MQGRSTPIDRTFNMWSFGREETQTTQTNPNCIFKRHVFNTQAVLQKMKGSSFGTVGKRDTACTATHGRGDSAQKFYKYCNFTYLVTFTTRADKHVKASPFIPTY